MNIFHRKYSTSEVVSATGVTNDNLQNWLKRQLIIGQNNIDGGGSQGRHRQFSFFNLIEIATAKALIDAGMTDLKSVFQAANMFAHTGDEMRAPGCPFNRGNGCTLLIAGPGRTKEIFVSNKDSALALLSGLFEPGHIGTVVLNMDKVFAQALNAVGHSPDEVLNNAYPVRKVD